MTRLTDETGNRYGRLVVIERGHNSDAGQVRWWCECDCGELVLVRRAHLCARRTSSCGCLRRDWGREVAAGWLPPAQITHGLSGHPLASTWYGMHSRCGNPDDAAYHRYGGRGIYVCERWSGPDGLRNFVADMGERPEGRTLDRYPDNDGPYSPGNCRWATKREQALNRRLRARDVAGRFA